MLNKDLYDTQAALGYACIAEATAEGVRDTPLAVVLHAAARTSRLVVGTLEPDLSHTPDQHAYPSPRMAVDAMRDADWTPSENFCLALEAFHRALLAVNGSEGPADDTNWVMPNAFRGCNVIREAINRYLWHSCHKVVMLTAPTSIGKTTTIVESICDRLIDDDHLHVVYMLPNCETITQVTALFVAEFERRESVLRPTHYTAGNVGRMAPRPAAARLLLTTYHTRIGKFNYDDVLIHNRLLVADEYVTGAQFVNRDPTMRIAVATCHEQFDKVLVMDATGTGATRQICGPGDLVINVPVVRAVRTCAVLPVSSGPQRLAEEIAKRRSNAALGPVVIGGLRISTASKLINDAAALLVARCRPGVYATVVCADSHADQGDTDGPIDRDRVADTDAVRYTMCATAEAREPMLHGRGPDRSVDVLIFTAVIAAGQSIRWSAACTFVCAYGGGRYTASIVAQMAHRARISHAGVVVLSDWTTDREAPVIPATVNGIITSNTSRHVGAMVTMHGIATMQVDDIIRMMGRNGYQMTGARLEDVQAHSAARRFKVHAILAERLLVIQQLDRCCEYQTGNEASARHAASIDATKRCMQMLERPGETPPPRFVAVSDTDPGRVGIEHINGRASWAAQFGTVSSVERFAYGTQYGHVTSDQLKGSSPGYRIASRVYPIPAGDLGELQWAVEDAASAQRKTTFSHALFELRDGIALLQRLPISKQQMIRANEQIFLLVRTAHPTAAMTRVLMRLAPTVGRRRTSKREVKYIDRIGKQEPPPKRRRRGDVYTMTTAAPPPAPGQTNVTRYLRSGVGMAGTAMLTNNYVLLYRDEERVEGVSPLEVVTEMRAQLAATGTTHSTDERLVAAVSILARWATRMDPRGTAYVNYTSGVDHEGKRLTAEAAISKATSHRYRLV